MRNLRIVQSETSSDNMRFKTTAYMICSKCGTKKTFVVETDVVADKTEDAKEVTTWSDFSLLPIVFNGICFNCKYDKAA